MTTQANNINQLLSKEDKIKELSKEAIKDIYSRQIILKIAKNRKGYVKESSDLFKSLDVSKESKCLYEGIRNFDIQLYRQLDKSSESIEEAIIKEFTKDTSNLEDSKTDIMRYKLKKTSECCGVPKAVLCHNNIDEWYKTENK